MPGAAKKAMIDLASSLPDEVSWDDAMYQLYVRQKIQAGLDDVENGRVVPHNRVFAELDDEEETD